MTLVTFVQSTTYDLTPAQVRLPPSVWTAFTAINRVHGVWRWYRRIELYRNPNNLSQLLAGHIVNLVIGETLLLRIAAQCLLVATRLLECSQQQASLYRAGSQWISAFKGNYPKPVRIAWEIQSSWSGPSPSTVHWWKVTGTTLFERIIRIVMCTLQVGKEAFRLSMCIMDTIDALCVSPASRNDGINESFVNITKWLDASVDHKEELLTGITENRLVIEKILKGSPFTYTQLHDGVAKTLEHTEIAQQGMKTLSTFGNGIITEFFKRAFNGTKIVLGIT